MSGIFGLLNRSGEPIDAAVLHAIGERLAFLGLDDHGYWQEDNIGLGCQLNRVTPESVHERQPARDGAGRTIVFDGRLDNREEVAEILSVSADAPDSAFVLSAYARWGNAAAEHLTGDFAFGLWDARLRQLLLVRDHMGVRPLYYFCGPDLCVFGTEVKAVLAHPRVVAEPDMDMLADYIIRDRQDMWGITFFRGIRSLPPGHHVVVTAAEHKQVRYWDFDPMRQVRLSSQQEYVEAFSELWTRAVKRRLRSRFPVAVSLSGGVDSSAVFCTAETLRRRHPSLPAVIGVQQAAPPGTPAYEQEFIEAIEQMYGITVEKVRLDYCRHPVSNVYEQVWNNEGPWFDVQSENASRLLSHLRDRGTRVMLTGIWGDQFLSEQSYLIDLVKQFRWREAVAQLNEIPRWFTDAGPTWFRRTFYRQVGKLLLPNAALQLHRYVRDRLRRPERDRKWYSEGFRRRAKWSGWEANMLPPAATERAKYLYQMCRSRHVLMMEQLFKRAATYGLESWHPFLDRELIAFLMAIPGDAANENGVPKAILRQAMKGTMPESIVNRKWKADFGFLENDAARNGFQEFARLLCSSDSAVAQFGIVDAHAVRQGFAALERKLHDAKDCSLSWELSDVVSVEAWMQVFFRGTIRSATGDCSYATID